MSTKTTRGKSKVVGNVDQKPTGILKTGNDTLPIVQYFSAVAVHTTLLSFTALYLPRTAFLYDLTRPAWDPTKQSSRDKPQHPFLDQLTMSPVSTMAWICLGVVFVQAWWGGSLRRWYIGTVVGVQGSEGDQRMQRVSMEGQSVKHLKDACIATLLASVAYHIVLVLLGAPLTNCSTPFVTGADCPSDNLHLRTYLLALLLALLTVPAPAYSIGTPKLSGTTHDSQTLVHRLLWTRLFAECTICNSFERALVYPSVGTLMGSWIGAIPIALDWDRPWQAWPLTPAYGAIVGYIIASLAALTVGAINFFAVEHLRAQAISEPKPKLKAKSA